MEKVSTTEYQFEIDNYLSALKIKLLHPDNWTPFGTTAEWMKALPDNAGVFVLKQVGQIVYAGETINLRERILDFIDQRRFTMRMITNKNLRFRPEGFDDKKGRKIVAEQVKRKIINQFTGDWEIAFLEVPLGRKELEELVARELSAQQ